MRYGSLILLIIIMFVAPLNVSAAKGPGCDFFTYQEDAQFAFDDVAVTYPTLVDMYAANMDPDGNGIACEELPAKPGFTANYVSIRGRFERDTDRGPVIQGMDYSNRFTMQLAGVTFENSSCPDLITHDILNQLVLPEEERVSPFLFTSANGINIAGNDNMKALVWTPIQDPANPLLLNEWLLLNGVGQLNEATAQASELETMREAEETAKASSLGIWGDCQLPAQLHSNAEANPYAPMFQSSGKGDQIVPFDLHEEGLYQVTLDVLSADVTLVFLDVYTVDGTWLSNLSIATSESGTYSSALNLQPGSYYIQIKAIDGWRVRIEPM